jgi:chromate transporter
MDLGHLIELALVFAKLYPFSFGGGYVMIPIMMNELIDKNWATASELTDIIAIAGMAPGSVAINASIGLGYKVAGFPGAIASFLGIAIPTIILVVIGATFFFKIYKHPKVKAAFYGLRPVITGIILYAAVSFALKNGVIAAPAEKIIANGWNVSVAGVHVLEVKSMLITLCTIALLIKTKIHPVFIIMGAGILGTLIF